jgi:hypothetical protein
MVDTPLWQRLEELNFAEKENALIQLEVPHDLPPALLGQVREIEELWNTGEFDRAIGRLRDLEKPQGLPGIAVGISWKVPIRTSGPKWGTDVQIGAQNDIRKPCLDFEDGTGNLFAVLKRGATNPWWTTNISTDGGATWQETYTWSGDGIVDVSAAVMDTFLYVAYVAPDEFGAADVARMRRFFTRDGAVDNVYYYVVVFDRDIDIKEVALSTDEDAYPDWALQIYYLAILADGSLVYYLTNDGLSWISIATGITDADRGLDACMQRENWFLWVSYIDSENTVHVARRYPSVGWESIALEVTGTGSDVTSVAAYENRIMVVYEYIDYEIKYMVSFNEGDDWYYGYVAYSLDEPPYFHEPHVAGRRGGGFAFVYEHEVGGEPDTCWFIYRDYGTGPGTAAWSVPQPFNEVDVWTGWPMTIEWIPPLDPACHAYGATWIGGGAFNAYFDRIDYPPGDANADGGVDLGDAVYILNYLFKGGPAPGPLQAGDANSDGLVGVGDAIFLLNYLFKGGPPPECP